MIDTHAKMPGRMSDFLSAQLDAVRPWLALCAALGAAGTWAAVTQLQATSGMPMADILLHISSGTVLTLSAIWLLLTRGSVLKFSIILLMVEALLLTARMTAGFLTTDPSVGISDALPPLSIWIPLTFIASFILMRLREALYFTSVLVFVLMLGAAIFVAKSPDKLGMSYDMLNIALQYLFMHPLLLLLLYLAARISSQHRLAMQDAYAFESALSRRLEQDDRQTGMSRPGFLNLLERAMEGLEAGETMVLVECRLQGLEVLHRQAQESAVDATVRRLMECLRSSSDTELVFGRMDTDQIFVLMNEQAHDDLELNAVRTRLKDVAQACGQGTTVDFQAARLECGMTLEIALKTLELTALRAQS